MPVYNGGHYFAQAVESALAQTYDDVEIIIVNDGSRDGGETDRVGRGFAEQCPDKVRYFRQDNTGVAGALNHAIERMTGDVFCWLSHDDLYVEDKIARQVAVLQKLQADVLLFSDWTYIGPAGEALYDVILDREKVGRSAMSAVLSGAVNGCTVMIPRKVLSPERRFDARYRTTQDYRLWGKLAREVNFFHMSQVLVKQRLHPDQDTNRLSEVASREGEALWTDLILETSSVERASLDGSGFRFLSRMVQQLGQMPFPGTQMAVEQAAAQALEQLDVTTIFMEDWLGSCGRPGLPTGSDGTENADQPGEGVGAFGPVSSRSTAQLRDHLLCATGEYVAVGQSNKLLADRVLAQARTMAANGTLVSVQMNSRWVEVSGENGVDPYRLLIDSTEIQALLFHRLLLSCGLINEVSLSDLPVLALKFAFSSVR